MNIKRILFNIGTYGPIDRVRLAVLYPIEIVNGYENHRTMTYVFRLKDHRDNIISLLHKIQYIKCFKQSL